MFCNHTPVKRPAECSAGRVFLFGGEVDEEGFAVLVIVVDLQEVEPEVLEIRGDLVDQDARPGLVDLEGVLVRELRVAVSVERVYVIR